jgi:hypothetical protein
MSKSMSNGSSKLAITLPFGWRFLKNTVNLISKNDCFLLAHKKQSFSFTWPFTVTEFILCVFQSPDIQTWFYIDYLKALFHPKYCAQTISLLPVKML